MRVVIYFPQHSDLVVPDEHALFKMALRWLQHQEQHVLGSKFVLHNLVLDVLSAIRFPLILVGQLRSLEVEAHGTYLQEYIREKVCVQVQV